MQVLLLNMWNMLELSGLFVCSGGLINFLVPGAPKNCWVMIWLGGSVPKMCLFIEGLCFDILCHFFLISSWFYATVAAYWKHWSSSLIGFIIDFFIQSEESIYDAPCFRFILCITFEMQQINRIKDLFSIFHQSS